MTMVYGKVAKWKDLDKKLEVNGDLIHKIKEPLRVFTMKWRKERQATMGFLDFLYYSIGISTTTTFGDIMANDKFIRFLISLQLILSIFILGGFINSVKLLNSKKDKY